MVQRQTGLRVACVQFGPVLKQREHNAETVRKLTASLRPGDADIVMLPEMALSGYVFEDARQIAPVLEDPSSGEQASPSLALAVELSVRLACYVLIGLPCKSTSFPCDSYRFSELYSVTEPYDARSESVQRVVPVHDAEAAYNAALLVDAKGEIVHIFRKHFSFLNDKIWATEGPGFETVDLPNIGRVCVAICMDINPYDFQAPFEDFELAQYCKRERVDVLLMNLAWLASEEEQQGKEQAGHDEQQQQISSGSMQHCNYLATRLSPYLTDATPSAVQTFDPPQEALHFVTCNRIGTEQGSRFGGSSFAMQFLPGSPPVLEGIMGEAEEGVRIFTMHTDGRSP